MGGIRPSMCEEEIEIPRGIRITLFQMIVKTVSRDMKVG